MPLPAQRPDINPADRAGAAYAGPVLTPDKVANYLRVHRSHDLGMAVDVDYIPEHEMDLPEGESSDKVTAWLELQDFIAAESGSRIIEHLVVPAEVLLEEESVLAVRDCHFVVSGPVGETDGVESPD